MRLLVVIDSYFPYGAAISSRVRVFCDLFSSIGYDIHVIALSSLEDINIHESAKYGKYVYQAVNSGNIPSYKSFVGDTKLITAIIDYLARNEVDAIFSTSCFPYFNSLQNAARQQKIPLFVEQCEWHDVSSYKMGKYDPRHIRAERLRKAGYKNANGIISISRLLDEHYKSMGIPSVRIPTILDVKDTNYEPRGYKASIINIVYTGNPGKSKEYLRPVIEALALHPEYRERIVFHIYGPTKELVSLNVGDVMLLDRAGSSVVLHGKVSQKLIENILTAADYQLFIRPDRRSSNAGFPTKLGESMAVGTPVIANDTGDIGMYLKDEYNGFVVDDNTTKGVVKVFEKLIRLHDDDYHEMRKNARKTAEEVFDYRVYAPMVKEFFEKNSISKHRSERETNAL